MSLEKILTAYANGNNLELEVRFKNIDKDTFISFYKKIKDHAEFTFIEHENSINTITDSVLGERYKKNINYIRKQVFEGTKKIDDIYYKKTQLIPQLFVTDHLNYSINLSEERPIGPFVVPLDSLVRMKHRAAFKSGAWRFDLTMVRSQKLNIIGPSLLLLKNELFSKGDDFLGADFAHINEYSIEIEHITTASKPTSKDIKAVVNKLFGLGDEKFISKLSYDETLLVLAKLLVKNNERLKKFINISLKKITNQVVALNKSTYKNIFPPIGYFITEKADGVRTIIYIQNGRGLLINDATMKEFEAPETVNLTIIDSEAVGKGPAKYLIFDIMYLDGADLTERPVADRLDKLTEAANLLKGLNIPVEIKKFIHMGSAAELKKTINTIYNAKKYDYAIDGIIMTSPDKNGRSYKWKPLEKQTIDFLAKSVPASLLGKAPFISAPKCKLYVLFVGISQAQFESSGITRIIEYKTFFKKQNYCQANYFPIQFMPSSNPAAFLYNHKKTLPSIDEKIVELNYLGGHWNFIKVREDRAPSVGYFGNDFKVAESIFQTYYQDFNLNELIEPHFGYFNVNKKDSIYYFPDKFKRFAAHSLYKEHIGAIVIDLASGRGGDLLKMRELGVKQVVAVDKDADAIAELIQRKYTYKGKGSNSPMMIHTLIMDLNAAKAKIIGEFAKFNITTGDTVVCNFAIHYFCDTAQHIKMFIALVAALLKPGGIFIFITLDGAQIFDKLTDINFGESWKLIEGAIDKYTYTKKYNSGKLENVGQLINVKMPFSDTNYDESLANLDFIISLCRRQKMELVANSSVMDFYNNYIHMDKLTDVDKCILSMTNYVIVRKRN